MAVRGKRRRAGQWGPVVAGGDGERGGRLRRERKLEFGHGFDGRDCMHES